MIMRKVWFYLLVVLLACKPEDKMGSSAPNSPETLKKPYVVLVSMDGFRYDYVEKYKLPNLKRIATEGVSAEAMIPVFPSKTFPNHYSIVTGLYPEKHGIVSNSFYDPDRNQNYRIGDRSKVEDGSWYAGTPLWVLAEKQGMRAASFFWVGSEADIQGVRPSYYFNYDSSILNCHRVEQVINWLKLPEDQRPHFITLYFSDIDSKGHDYGPDSEELAEVLVEIDKTIADLDLKLSALDLEVNLIITSDHGMIRIDQEQPIRIDKIIDLSDFYTISNGTNYMLYGKEPAKIDQAFEQLQAVASNFEVYRKSDMPDYLHYKNNNRIGDLLIIAQAPYVIADNPILPRSPGTHGYDSRSTEEMMTIFYAKGPAFQSNMRIEPFENIHIYPMITSILGLHHGPIDGDIQVLSPILIDK